MHLIQQHTFNIQCSSQNFGKELQQQLSRVLEKEFYPKLAALFNKYQASHLTINIEELAIKIPPISKRSWKEELIQKSLAQIEDYLKRQQLYSLSKKDLSISASLIPKSQHVKHIFFTFLNTGQLIENTIAKNLEHILAKIEINETFIETLLLNFTENNHSIIRWIFSVSSFFKENVIKKLSRSSNEFTEVLDVTLINTIHYEDIKIRNVLEKTNHQSTSKESWVELVQWINYLQNKKNSTTAFLKVFIQFSEEFFDLKPEELNSICEFILKQRQSQSQNQNISRTTIIFKELKKALNYSNNPKEGLKNREHRFKENDLQMHEPKKGKDVSIENRHYIKNAGLVLLHPFFKTLFQQLDLCNIDGEWYKKINQHKAILLTQYLITGQEKIQEDHLILNKILCGFSIEKVVNVKLKIVAKEKEKCKSLLMAINEHWKPMNASSAEALQETFLQREGKLELANDSSYNLWVEEKGYDILLEQIPWGVATIQTQWMENYLICNWSY